jgi:hypothetical protein
MDAIDEAIEKADTKRWVRVDFDASGAITGMELHNVSPSLLYAVAGYANLQADMMTAAMTAAAQNTGLVAARSIPRQ